jgi:hypothetical protein
VQLPLRRPPRRTARLRKRRMSLAHTLLRPHLTVKILDLPRYPLSHSFVETGGVPYPKRRSHRVGPLFCPTLVILRASDEDARRTSAANFSQTSNRNALFANGGPFFSAPYEVGASVHPDPRRAPTFLLPHSLSSRLKRPTFSSVRAARTSGAEWRDRGNTWRGYQSLAIGNREEKPETPDPRSNEEP